jgi:hypothetical protein
MAKNREIDPVSVVSLVDIRKVISPFLEEDSGVKREAVEIRTEIKWTDEDQKRRVDWSSVSSEDMTSSQILMEGFNLIKARMEMLHKANELAETSDEDDELLPERIRWSLLDIDKQYFSIDSFIKNRLGGRRKGLRIRWEVSEGVYEFDPYTKKLFEVTE